jgi:hypothetical protein
VLVLGIVELLLGLDVLVVLLVEVKVLVVVPLLLVLLVVLAPLPVVEARNAASASRRWTAARTVPVGIVTG